MHGAIRGVVAILVILACIPAANALFGRTNDKYGMLRPPTGLKSSNAPDQWFTQILDHYNPQDTRKWQQRYYVNDRYFNASNPNAPVFIFIGAEGELRSGWVENGIMADYGKPMGALLVALEHRYYGASQPFPALTLEALRFLTSDQALADLANFILSYPVPRSHPWIAYGGSYSGSLAAWARLRYPTLIKGALASSAPVDPKVNFTEYYQVAKNALHYYGGDECIANFKNATDTVNVLLQTAAGRAKLSQKLNLCRAIDMSHKGLDVDNFWASLTDTFAGVVQYNKDGASRSVRTVCDRLAQRPGYQFDTWVTIMNELFGGECLNWEYKEMVKYLQNLDPRGSGMRQWIYQTCTQFGFYQTLDSDQPFGPRGSMPLSLFTQLCQDAYSKSFTSEYVHAACRQSEVTYGSIDIQSSNIVFTNGNIDPWHALSVLDVKSTQNPTMSSVMSNSTSHCAILYAPSSIDPPSIIQAREEVRKVIQTFVDAPY